MSIPGWYQDPEGEGWRWWDGTAWGPRQAPVPPQPAGYPVRRSSIWGSLDPRQGRSSAIGSISLGIDFNSTWARRLSELVAVGAGCAAALAAALIAYTFVVGPFPGAAWLILPAIPVLIVGQLWCIVILNARQEARHQASGGTTPWWRRRARMRDLRGGLPMPVAILFMVLFYGVVLVGAGLMIFGLALGVSNDAPFGTPTDDPASCEHTLNNHGDYRCLTDSEHEREQVAGQRFAAGVMFGFFIGHCGLATGEVLHRRQVAATVAATDPDVSDGPDQAFGP